MGQRIPNFGSDFKRPSKKRYKEHKAEGGDKLFTRDEALKLLNGTLNGVETKDKKGKRVWLAPNSQLHAMIFLGINCGFGNTDVAELPPKAIDLKK